ncbi:DUF3179 domain-containing protein [Hoeflea sp.]|uniref:DUF3179 domain-containing protein n=1 Tax=Hoeflea sp. TaxID=1940281 RepID=UPI00198E213C|nr:DUF3179 domain-containing protein [Hoeflea sp.]MBC7285627.1 DUF3179 domain-containing protein [Hoeflea sp.]
MIKLRRFSTFGLAAALAISGTVATALAQARSPSSAASAFEERFSRAWPNTDFSSVEIPASEILSGGPPRDGIPSIDTPQFVRLKNGKPSEWASRLRDKEPVISIEISGDARAYPLRILMWHEIVNDEVGVMPIAVTYCPLCNASIVFDRRMRGQVLDFGTTGLLRHSDLVMYDRQTESWWQQFTGSAFAGTLQGHKLKMVPSRLESFAAFRQRHPSGLVLVPEDPNSRQYGVNPYGGYDSAAAPGFLTGEVNTYPLAAMDRVVVFELDGAPAGVALDYLRSVKRVAVNDVVLEWEPGQASALDTRNIADGKDVGNVVVQKRVRNAKVDIPHQVTFAFAYRSFFPAGAIIGLQFNHGAE